MHLFSCLLFTSLTRLISIGALDFLMPIPKNSLCLTYLLKEFFRFKSYNCFWFKAHFQRFWSLPESVSGKSICSGVRYAWVSIWTLPYHSPPPNSIILIINISCSALTVFHCLKQNEKQRQALNTPWADKISLIIKTKLKLTWLGSFLASYASENHNPNLNCFLRLIWNNNWPILYH